MLRCTGEEADIKHNKMGVCALTGDRCFIMPRERDRFVDCRTCMVPVAYILVARDK